MATIKQRNGSYQIVVSCGYDAKGKHLRRSMTWTPEPGMTARQIEKELNRQATLFEERVRTGGAPNSSIKLEVYAEQWFTNYAEKNLKESTVARYRKLSRRLYQALGAKRIDRITVADVQSLVDNLGETGIKIQRTKKDATDQPEPAALAPKTIRAYHSLLSAILESAVKLEMIPSNPCRKVTLPPLKATEKDVYTLDEASRFLELLEGENWQYRAFFTLAIYTGMRRGELLGLQWGDFDFDSGIVTISRNTLYTGRKGLYDDTPKTKSSRRVLKLPAVVLDMLHDYRIWQLEQRFALGDQWHDCDRLFTRWNGEPMHADTPYYWLVRFCGRKGLRRMGVHSFRHLNATLLIDAGVDVKTTSALLGHSTSATTMNIYAHSFAAAQARASEAVADVLTLGVKNQKEKPPQSGGA